MIKVFECLGVEVFKSQKPKHFNTPYSHHMSTMGATSVLPRVGPMHLPLKRLTAPTDSV